MINTLKTLIIDDESLARDLIRNFLKDNPRITLMGECSDGFEAVKLIREQEPDLIFLDVQMPKLTGFEMLELLEDPPMIIFTTAYDEYALKAFERNAVDYLLKPFTSQRMNEALERAFTRQQSGMENPEPIKTLSEETVRQKGSLERIVVKTGHRVNVIPVEKVIAIQAEDDYATIISEEGKFLKQQTLKFYEQYLDPKMFSRVHRSFIINLNWMKQVEPFEKDSYRIVLKNGLSVPVSRSGYARLRQKLNF